MRLLKLSTMQRWSLRIIGGICPLIFLFWGACHLFLPGVIKNAAGDYGKKIGDGSPDEVRNNPDVISAYLGTSH